MTTDTIHNDLGLDVVLAWDVSTEEHLARLAIPAPDGRGGRFAYFSNRQVFREPRLFAARRARTIVSRCFR
jgi:hypothetical protein